LLFVGGQLGLLRLKTLRLLLCARGFGRGPFLGGSLGLFGSLRVRGRFLAGCFIRRRSSGRFAIRCFASLGRSVRLLAASAPITGMSRRFARLRAPS